MAETNWSRIEAWAAWAAVIVVLLTGMMTTWGKIERLDQRMTDADADRAVMQQTLERIEQTVLELKH